MSIIPPLTSEEEADYIKLLVEMSPKPIETEKEYRRQLKLVEELESLAKLSKVQRVIRTLVNILLHYYENDDTEYAPGWDD